MKFHRIIIVVLIGFVLLTAGSCKVMKLKNQERKALKQKEKEEEQLQKTYRNEIKAHYKMQSGETRKRMKKNFTKVRKQSKKENSSYWRCN